MTRLPAGSTLLFDPLEGFFGGRAKPLPSPVIAPVNISASLSAEDDFELTSEFLDVFQRAGERVLGFCVGGLAIAAVWMLASAI